MPRMSTSPVSFSCWHPILVAMKHPVRPMPALQDGHGCAEHPQHKLDVIPGWCAALIYS